MMEEKIEISDESTRAFHANQIERGHDDQRNSAIQKKIKDKVKIKKSN